MIFIEDEGFRSRRQGLMSDAVLFSFMEWLVLHPDAGRIIRGSGGLRKVRWSARGRGKRGGVRIIYFWWIAESKILLHDINGKGQQEDLSVEEIRQLKRKVIL